MGHLKIKNEYRHCDPPSRWISGAEKQKKYPFTEIAIVLLFLVLSTVGRSQKVIDSISRESCDCMEKLLSIMKLPVEDSLTNCVTVSISNHMGALGKEKKLNPVTEEGIQEIHERVRKSLKKKCRVFTGK